MSAQIPIHPTKRQKTKKDQIFLTTLYSNARMKKNPEVKWRKKWRIIVVEEARLVGKDDVEFEGLEWEKNGGNHVGERVWEGFVLNT